MCSAALSGGCPRDFAVCPTGWVENHGECAPGEVEPARPFCRALCLLGLACSAGPGYTGYCGSVALGSMTLAAKEVPPEDAW